MQLKTLPVLVSDTSNAPSLVPDPESCHFSTLAPPPPAVQDVRLITTQSIGINPETDQLELQVGVSWTRPQGRVEGYQVRVVEMETLTDDGAGEVFALQKLDVSGRRILN